MSDDDSDRSVGSRFLDGAASLSIGGDEDPWLDVVVFLIVLGGLVLVANQRFGLF